MDSLDSVLPLCANCVSGAGANVRNELSVDGYTSQRGWLTVGGGGAPIISMSHTSMMYFSKTYN